MVKISFQISLHEKDLALLKEIKDYFSVGKIYRSGKIIQFRVETLSELEVILNHFDRYTLITQKRADYELFKQAFYIIKDKTHLTPEGLTNIVAIKATMNLGLSDKLKAIFPEIISMERPVINQKIPDPNWLAGFSSAEGSFIIKIINSPGHKLKATVQLVFQLTQHKRDENLMQSFIEYLDCGNLNKDRECLIFIVRTISDLTNKIIPFFKEHPIKGVKLKDFEDFCKAAELIKIKAHLSKEGLDQIIKIKEGMNTKR